MVYSVAQSYKTYLTMDANAAGKPGPERIRFQVQDEEAAAGASGGRGRTGSGAADSYPPLARTSTAISEDGMSVRQGSQRGSMTIEPAAALPIQYRTL